MEALGSDNFGNASAVEWAVAYREMGLGVAASTLEVALGDASGGDLNPDIAARGIAAAEAVAFAMGRGSDKAAELFAGAPAADAAEAEALAERAMQMVRAVGGEELPGGLADLQNRLKGQAAVAAPTAEPTIEAAPVASAPAGDLASEVAALREEVLGLRKQMNRNFAKLAQIIEEGRA